MGKGISTTYGSEASNTTGSSGSRSSSCNGTAGGNLSSEEFLGSGVPDHSRVVRIQECFLAGPNKNLPPWSFAAAIFGLFWKVEFYRFNISAV